jgi:hypothetical protein
VRLLPSGLLSCAEKLSFFLIKLEILNSLSAVL